MKWTLEKCKEIALKYKTKKDFIENEPNVYNASYKKGYLDEICKHMTLLHYQNFWNKDKCQIEALKYTNKKDFREQSSSAYFYAYNNDFLDKICSHMNTLGHKYKRCIYAFEFNDNTVYIGLTYNYNERIKQHLKDHKSTVYKKIKTNNNYNTIQLTDYLDKNDASKLEIEYIIKYKNNNWIILNKNKGGSLGSKNVLITKEECHLIALKYNTIKEFKKYANNYYQISIKRKWIKDITNHMIELKKPANYWTFENCLEESKKYKNKNQFYKNCSGAYNKSYKNNWLIIFFPTTKR